MMLTIYLVTLLGVIAAQVSPGPNLVAVASVALAQGRRAALFVVTGVASGMLVWSVLTALGLGALIEAFPKSLLMLKLIGGGFLLFLGIKAARAAIQSRATATISPDNQSLSNVAAWRRGLWVLLTNPKAALMWAAVASFLFGHGLGPLQVLIFGPIGAISGLVIYGTYAMLFSTDMAMRGYSRFAKWFEGLFAAAFSAMGVSLIWSGVREAQR